MPDESKLPPTIVHEIVADFGPAVLHDDGRDDDGGGATITEVPDDEGEYGGAVFEVIADEQQIPEEEAFEEIVLQRGAELPPPPEGVQVISFEAEAGAPDIDPPVYRFTDAWTWTAERSGKVWLLLSAAKVTAIQLTINNAPMATKMPLMPQMPPVPVLNGVFLPQGTTITVIPMLDESELFALLSQEV